MKALVGLVFCLFAAVIAVRIPEEAKRVVGGISVKEGDYPFNVAVYYKEIFLCSGAFIGLDFIVTSADCIYPYSTGPSLPDVTVQLGSINSTHAAGPNVYTAAAVDIHPNYTRAQDRDFTLHYSNVAVITLTTTVEQSPTISPVALPLETSLPLPEGSTLNLIGWGHRRESAAIHKHSYYITEEDFSDGIVSDKLEVASLITIDVVPCITESGGDPAQNPESVLCTAAYDPSNGSQEGACTMDHGSPLIMRGPVVHLHGLVSWADCELESGGIKPTIYTNILAHRAWIRTVTEI